MSELRIGLHETSLHLLQTAWVHLRLLLETSTLAGGAEESLVIGLVHVMTHAAVVLLSHLHFISDDVQGAGSQLLLWTVVST